MKMNWNTAENIYAPVAVVGYPVLLMLTTESHWALLQIGAYWALLVACAIIVDRTNSSK